MSVKDIVWTTRGPGEISSVGKYDPTMTMYDESLSPDYLVLPADKVIPKHLRGRRCEVAGSLTLDFAPNPSAPSDAPDKDKIIWQSTRWHLFKDTTDLAVAEVVGHGWVFCKIDRVKYANMLQVCALQLRMQLHAVDV